MRLIASIKNSTKALKSNKVRTALTIIGMVIGITSIVVVLSSGRGINNLLLGQIESFGSDFIETEIKIPSRKTGAGSDAQGGISIAQGVQITSLTTDDMNDIDKLPNIAQSYAGIMSQELVSYNSEKKKGIILGVSPTYIDIDRSEVAEGRFFSDAENSSLSRVAVLGSGIKETLFGDGEVVGKSISIKGSKYRVIGIMEERGAVMTMDFDDYIYLPIKTLQKRLLGVDHVSYIIHQVIDMDIVEETADEVRSILRINHEIDTPEKEDFRVVTMLEMMDMMDSVTNYMTLLLIVIVFISLIVGGVGIMNVMYVVVSERTMEIGIRKAVGASNKNILMQFLFESVVITVLSGIIGLGLGILISYVISYMAERQGLDWGFSVPWYTYLTVFIFSLVFGLFFGIYPAKKASKLTPVEAIRT